MYNRWVDLTFLALHILVALAEIFSVDFLISISNIFSTCTGTMKPTQAKLQSEIFSYKKLKT